MRGIPFAFDTIMSAETAAVTVQYSDPLRFAFGEDT